MSVSRLVDQGESPKSKKQKIKGVVKKPYHQWKHGSVVRVRSGVGYSSYEGINAVVLKQDEGDDQVLIQFDRELPGLHNGHGDGAERRCWFLSSRNVMHYFDARAAEVQRDEAPSPEVEQEVEQEDLEAHIAWRRGTLVRVKRDVGWNQYIDVDATVLHQEAGEEQVLIQFNQEMPHLHDGDGRGGRNRCLYVGDSQIMSYSRAPTMAESIYGSDEVNISVNSEDGDEESVEESAEDNLWPNFGITTAVSDAAEEYHRKQALKRDLCIALGEEAPTTAEPEEEELEEVEEEERVQRHSGHYRMAGLPNTYSTGRSKKVSIKPKPNPRLCEGRLCKVLKANGDRTIYDSMAAVIVAHGKFGRFLLQFDQKVRGGHDGKGVGEPGRCRWFYKKDVVAIDMGEAIALGKPRGGQIPKKSRGLRPKLTPSPWKPSGGIQPDQSSDSMWDVEDVPAVKKMQKEPSLPPFIASGKMARGSRVLVHQAPSDNKALKGKQGIIISDTAHNSNVTVQFDEKILGCHDANGHGKPGRCWNLHKMFLKSVATDVVLYIKEDYERRGKNLKGMEVKMLAYITRPTGESLSIVEFTEEIPKGHSADGKGKRAHCLSVPASLIGKRKKEKPKKIKKPHEVKAKKEAGKK